MSTDKTLQIQSLNVEQTEKLGKQIGRSLHGNETIELISDLGGGKTTFVRGLAEGAGSEDVVGSPTFMISKVYNARRFTIHHFDFYRLGEAGIVGDELDEVVNDPKAVVIVEWGDIVSTVLPTERVKIRIDRVASDEGARAFQISAPESLSYVLEGLAEAEA